MQTTPHTTARPSHRLTGRIAAFGLLTTLAVAGFTSPAHAERSYFAWAQVYDRQASSSQNGVAVATDRRGNVAATGYVFINNVENYYTAKYDALTGAKLWEATYNGGFGANHPASVVCDSLGNVIVTGLSYGASNTPDYYTVKYAASNGAVLWSRRYDNGGEDKAVKVAVDPLDNIIVTGSSVSQSNHEDFYTVKYNSAGTVQWSQRYDSAGHFIDQPTALFVDASGNVAVTGVSRVGSNNCFYTAKYNSAGAKIWEKNFDGLGGKDDTGEGVAMDAIGNVLVTGTVINADGTYAFHTIKYSSGLGNIQWEQNYNSPVSSYTNPAGLVVDAAGNAIIAGTSVLDNFKTTFYVAKYDATNGSLQWEKRTDAPGDTDTVSAIAIDAYGNPIVAGDSQNTDLNADFYTVKFAGTSGAIQWEQRINGDNDSGTDTLKGISVDAVGNVAVTGTGKKASPSPYFEMVTLKLNRFLLSPGDPITGPGLTSAAVITAFNVPALADSAALGAKVTVKDGKKTYAAILAQGSGGNQALAMQTIAAPDVPNAFFKSFSDPVISPNGREAFAAKLSGVSGTLASGVWTNVFTGTLQCALQLGTQVPGLASGVLLKSVTSISVRDGYLAALITVKGPGVNGTNSTVLLGLNAKNSGYELLRTGDMVSADGTTSAIKKLSVYNPPKSSPGQGRYHGNAYLLASATLADKRTVILQVNPNGGYTALAATNGDASSVVNTAKWKTFGYPSTGTNGFNYCTLATLQPKLGGVTTATDTAIVYSFLGGAFNDIATEGGAAAETNGGTYTSFLDPVSNDQGRYAFLAKAKGGDFGAAKSGLWFGLPGALKLVTRVGAFAPDAIGNDGPSSFSTITNLALPGGTGSGPIFLATVKGGGANGKNNTGLWGVDSTGFDRQLLRNGDILGDQTVKKFVLLNSLPGCFSANRSFNGVGGVAALVSFTDKTQAVVYVGIP